MHRLTAKVLLILLLVSILAPIGLALTAPATHACCLRKPMHDLGPRGAQINAPPGCCHHDCCRPLTISQKAGLYLSASYFQFESRNFYLVVRPFVSTTRKASPHSGRAPPQLPNG
jgi:hypothetical protein